MIAVKPAAKNIHPIEGLFIYTPNRPFSHRILGGENVFQIGHRNLL